MIQIEDILKSGEAVYIKAVGRSMWPTFRHKVDFVEITPCDTSTLEVGDVVFFNRGDQYCLHRIIRRDGDKLVIRGDGNRHDAFEYARLSDVAGKVTGGTMRGGKQFVTTDEAWKRNTNFVLKHHYILSQWRRLCDITTRYPLSIIVFILVVYLSFIKSENLILTGQDTDKIVHFVMYFGTALIFWFEWLRSHRRNGRKTISRGLVFCFCFPVLLGGLMELGQTYLTEYRNGEWMDFFANMLGAMFATVVSLLVTAPIIRKQSVR